MNPEQFRLYMLAQPRWIRCVSMMLATHVAITENLRPRLTPEQNHKVLTKGLERWKAIYQEITASARQAGDQVPCEVCASRWLAYNLGNKEPYNKMVEYSLQQEGPDNPSDYNCDINQLLDLTNDY